MPFKKKIVWLCTGDILGRKKKLKPCVYAVIKIENDYIPIFASSQKTRKITRLSVLCKKKLKYVRKWIKECKDFQNSNLDKILIKDKSNI